ncbi:hypothetical protein [Nitrospirillum iridis]|uniref:Uncharacterized protein n=1 Tax=Nitrospirillum iridis TaxID=765888 RepID=A0A7X0B1P9_9PROT|nr:hypothetical protein [Nitrospirillum iridis]MBB6254108.1 hypothetical protein [Nitrospirillum iridis]
MSDFLEIEICRRAAGAPGFVFVINYRWGEKEDDGFVDDIIEDRGQLRRRLIVARLDCTPVRWSGFLEVVR